LNDLFGFGYLMYFIFFGLTSSGTTIKRLLCHSTDTYRYVRSVRYAAFT